MTKPDNRSELDYLLTLSLEGTMTDEQRERLEHWMADDPEVQDYCMRFFTVAAGLRHPAMTAQGMPFPEVQSNRFYQRRLLGVGLAMVASILVLLGLVLWPEHRGGAVAVLVDTIKPAWGAELVYEVNDVLTTGPFEIQRGFAKLRFMNGVVAVVEGPARCQLEAVDALTLDYGKVYVHTSPKVAEFAVKTDETTVRDLGTAFGVEVDQLGNTEVQMYDGEAVVELESTAGSAKEKHLVEGLAGRVAAKTKQWDSFPWEENAFLRDFDSRHGVIYRGLKREIAVNCGGGAVKQFLADCCYQLGPDGEDHRYRRSHFMSELPRVPDEVVQTERFFKGHVGTYVFQVTPGRYTVELYFAEIHFSEPGCRVFSVDIEGTRVIEKLDILALTGKRGRSIARVFKDIDVPDGELRIDFIPVVENPKISGIRIYASEQ